MSETLLQVWTRTLHAAPDAVALIDASDERRYTRRELDALATDWATRHGAPLAGQTVIFSESNRAAWFGVFLGLLKASAVVAALDPGEPLEAQRTMAAKIGAGYLWNGSALEAISKQRPARDGRRLIKLTSGSTGVPAALRFTDGQMLADGRAICATMQIGPGDVNLGLIPFGHSYGLGNLVLPLLDQGTAIVCGASPFPQIIASVIARHGITVFPGVPALFRAMAGAEVDPAQLASLRVIVSAGAALEPEVASMFSGKLGKKIHNFYGSSETGGIAYDRTGAAAITGRAIGTPMAGVTLRFGRGGRFLVRSGAVFTLGNRHREGKNGVHSPADLGSLNAAGELVLHGRTGRFVKIGGRRANLIEIEQVLKKIPGVRDAHVEPHPMRAESLAAVIAGEVTAEQLTDALRLHLAAWKIPKKFVIIASFPLTARGKTDNKKLSDLLR